MNPFDLRGPEFLFIYAILAAGVLLLLHIIRRQREDFESEPLPKLEDPYLIAYLRGGPQATTETALISLIDRKRVTVSGGEVATQSDAGVQHPLEKALLHELSKPRRATEAVKLDLSTQTDGYQTYLVKNGFVPNGHQKAARIRDTVLACLFLAAFALIKIAVALARGRTNILFLVLLLIASLIGAAIIGNPRLTSRGTRAIDHLRTLLSKLKTRADSLRPNENTADLMLLAAVFGAAAIPVAAMPERQMLYPQNSSSGGDSGSSSSCGSSSCGSSCGGGCGGGCGGCGS